MIVMIFGVMILPTLIEMPDQLNQHTTSCVLPASLQVWRKKNSETEVRNSLILKECRKGRDAVRRKSSRSTLLRVQVVKPVFWFPSWWPPVRVLVLVVELSWSVLSLATNERLLVGTCDDGRCRGGSHSDYRGCAGLC